MIEEDVTLEIATLVREAERRIQTKMAERQTGDAFRNIGAKDVRSILLAAAVAGSIAGAAAPAQATGFHCSFVDHSMTCFRFDYEGAGSKIITVPAPTPAEIEARQAYTRKWESFCKPTVRTDNEGIQRYVYAHAGCDLGRAE